MPTRGLFDADGFYGALDAVRVARKLKWKDVASQTGVSASTLTRMAQGRRPDVDSLAALTKWSGLSADRFIRPAESVSEVPLGMISTYLRSDPNLSPEAATAIEEVIKAAYDRLRRD